MSLVRVDPASPCCLLALPIVTVLHAAYMDDERLNELARVAAEGAPPLSAEVLAELRRLLPPVAGLRSSVGVAGGLDDLAAEQPCAVDLNAGELAA